jgi:hypothetical protein
MAINIQTGNDLSPNTSSMAGIGSVFSGKLSALKAAARGFNVQQVNEVVDLTLQGRGDVAARIADQAERATGPTGADIICGPQPPRDFRRPIVTEYHVLSASAVGAGNAIMGTLAGVANWLPTATPNQRRFLQASEAPAAGAIMRPQELGRTLVGMAIKCAMTVQPNAAGNLAFPDETLSNIVADRYYQYEVQIFPSSSAEPLMDSTPVEYWAGGRKLYTNLFSPVVNDAFNVLVLEPGNAAALGTVLQGGPRVDFNTVCGGYFAVSGMFITGIAG